MASSTGLAVSQSMTDATIVALAADGDASGWAEHTAWRVGSLDPAATAREAAAKALRTRRAEQLERHARGGPPWRDAIGHEPEPWPTPRVV